jgi:hypothetical protein
MADGPLTAYDELTEHPRLGELSSIAHGVLRKMAEEHRALPASEARAKADELGIKAEETKTSFGDAIAVLERGPEDAAERTLACALWAHAIAENRPKEAEEEDKLARDLLWLATFTPFDATSLLDRALGEAASEMWVAIAGVVKKIDAQQIPTAKRAEALVGVAALALSSSEDAAKLLQSVAREANDPMLKKFATSGDTVPTKETRFTAQITASPRSPVATTALAFSGILFAMHAVGLVARYALALDRPAEVTLRGNQIQVDSKMILLGRTLSEKKIVIQKSQLARAGREVRYPRAAFYAGLLSLAVGSYFGISMLVDGTRSASPSLLLTGLIVVALGIAVDFALRSLSPSARGKTRLLFVPRRGPTICVMASDTKTADDALAVLAAKS